MSDTGAPQGTATDQLPSMAYRGWFLFVMVLVSASVVGERYMMAVMVGPIKADLGLTDTQIGLAKDLAIAIVYILAVMPLARLADRWSKRKMIALAATVWSVAVLLCGFAKSFWLLLLGRAAIGLGEGGFTPPSQSWIADHFPVKQRATAMAIFLLGASFGNFWGPTFGGYMTEAYGWREALLFASIPGFILVPIVLFGLRDVRPGLADGVSVEASKPQPFMPTVKALLKIKTLPLLIGSAAFNTLTTMGLVSWIPAYMERSYGMSAREAGIQMGGALLVGSVVGHSIGGPLADWLGRRDLRWYLWIMIIGAVGATLVAWLLLNGPKEMVFPLIGLNLLIGGMSAAPLLAVVSGLAPAHSRSVAVAMLMIAINVVGLGAGPAFIGWISDQLAPTYGDASLGVALRYGLLVGIPAILLAWLASVTCRADFERVGGWSPDKSALSGAH
jgi:MFS family permease